MLHKKIWVYGMPFSGKSSLVAGAANHFIFNTDGNAQYCTDSFKLLADEVVQDGRKKAERKYAWEFFEEYIEKLENLARQGKFPYSVVALDLVEDAYAMCREYMCQKVLHIEHESDDNLRAWDKVRGRFFAVMRRFVNLPCDIVLISHEDASRDLLGRNGDKVSSVKPNIQPKVADKLAGMVAVVGRVAVIDGKYLLQVKTDTAMFGGGRGGIKNVTLPLSWESVEKLFENFQKRA